VFTITYRVSKFGVLDVAEHNQRMARKKGRVAQKKQASNEGDEKREKTKAHNKNSHAAVRTMIIVLALTPRFSPMIAATVSFSWLSILIIGVVVLAVTTTATTSIFVESFSSSSAAVSKPCNRPSFCRRRQQHPAAATTRRKETASSSLFFASTVDQQQRQKQDKMQQAQEQEQRPDDINPVPSVSFSHVHLYADELDDLDAYKALEGRLNEFAAAVAKRSNDDDAPLSIAERRRIWESVVAENSAETSSSAKGAADSPSPLPAPPSSPSFFAPHGRDVVKQLLSGLGFRVTAARYDDGHNEGGAVAAGDGTRTVLVTSRDPDGVQILVTAKNPARQGQGQQRHHGTGEEKKDGDGLRIFDAGEFLRVLPLNFFARYIFIGSSHCLPLRCLLASCSLWARSRADTVDRFYRAHNSRPGIAVLGFLVDDLDRIADRYRQFHPELVVAHDRDAAILEVYAFYETEERRAPDQGTILRFVQQQRGGGRGNSNAGTWAPHLPLPGLIPVSAAFEDSSQAAYCDHWVSNVFSRTDFLDTLADTLGFSTKVDFNAGVVAAGEAQIESTVTGNDSRLLTQDKAVALRDQSQVYLPINNALSSVGHVHGFLQELGQGIQHLASRVDDLAEFVQRGNDYRKITGEGFTFLRIPRSYYGILTASQLQEGLADEASDGAGVSEGCASAIVAAMRSSGALAKDGAVDLDLTREDMDKILESGLRGGALEEYRSFKAAVLNVIVRSRYKNLYSLLRGHLSEDSYLSIVRNQILVDIQGDDLLYQIFTANILQRKAGDEAPFFEFIQRVCSECLDDNGCPEKVRPGCGGFGIRNFLTLFLSIEVSKAMREASDAEEAGDEDRAMYAQSMVDYFTEQLNESNPILTEISDAMTEEGRCKERVERLLAAGDAEGAIPWKEKMDAAAERKQQGNEELMACSARYNSLMKSLRENRNA